MSQETVVIAVYVGNYGTYQIPAGLMLEAMAVNNGKRTDDRRTRGGKIIEAWGKAQDKAAKESAK